MIKRITIKTMLVATLALAAVSCKKESSVGNADELAASQQTVSSSQAIAISASTTTAGDSIYVVNTCDRRSHRDSITFTSLPAAASTYLTTNYAGYTAQKAYSVKNTTGTITGYIAIIQYNGKPVGLSFNASGNFIKVLEQREGHDLNGGGWHHGGCFDDRDGLKRDTIALSVLSSSIKSYYAANYATDTLISAFKNRDSSIVVLSANNGLYATVFSTTGTFIKRAALPAKTGKPTSIDLSALPASAQSYLTITYPNYVYKHGFKIVSNTVVPGYVAFIDANGTKYAVQFDASGNFVKAVTVR